MSCPPHPTHIHTRFTQISQTGFDWLVNELVSLVDKEMLQMLIPNMIGICGAFKIKVLGVNWIDRRSVLCASKLLNQIKHSNSMLQFLCFSKFNRIPKRF